MEQTIFHKITALAERPEAVARSTEYMTANLGRFLKRKERVLICRPREDTVFNGILDAAIRACECEPIWLGEDCRWVTILKTAFTTKANCIVAPPLTLLGLSKIAKQRGTPLFARNVLMLGYPTTHWLVNGVRRGLDCMAWGCFDPWGGAAISGFTCQQLDGVHLRSDEYAVDIVDENGNSLPKGEMGRVMLYPKDDPASRLFVGDYARISTESCSCGCTAPKLVEIDTVKADREELSNLGEGLHYWSSVLDCRVERTECGLELEVVVFQGEKLPKLPTAARLIVRPFDPEKDEPFDHSGALKNRFMM